MLPTRTTKAVASSSWASRIALAALLEKEALGALKAGRRRQGLRREGGLRPRHRRAARSIYGIVEMLVFAQRDNVPLLALPC